MKFNKNYIVLSRDFATPAASIFYKTSPIPFKIIIPLFRCPDEYNWAKRKQFLIWFNESSLEDLRKTYGDDLIIARSKEDYKEIMKDADLCISLGREAFIFKPLAKKNIAYSGMGEYLCRYVDSLPHYEDLSIILDGPAWLDRAEIKSFAQQMPERQWEAALESREKFLFFSPLLEYKNILDEMDKDLIKKELGIPLNQKVALVSLRRADPWHTIYKNDEDFFKQSMKDLSKFKEMGYYIVCRRRAGVEDETRRRESSENTKYSELESFIDLEISTWGGFPDILYKLCHISDLLVLMDTSNLASKEASICELPTYSPYDDNDEFFKHSISQWNPSTRDMISTGVMTNAPSCDFFENYPKNINEFKKKWHKFGVADFWRNI